MTHDWQKALDNFPNTETSEFEFIEWFIANEQAIRAALQAQIEAKPVLWVEKDEYGDYDDGFWTCKEVPENKGITVYPLYAVPPAAPKD